MNERKDEVILMNNQKDVSEMQNNKENEEENRKLMTQNEPISPIEDINKSFEECTFGRFHVRLLFTTFAGFIGSILVMLSTSYLLPIAECDLDMNLQEKGLLTAMPFIGIFISTVISGFLIDTFGRILFLRAGYCGLFLFTLLSACSQNYKMFASAKLGEGLMSGIANTAIMSFTSEFCHPSVRDRVMIAQSAIATTAQIICPAMAWGMLTNNWELSLFDGAFVLKTWNFYLLAMSIWSLAGWLLYLTLPESPKFLVTQKKYSEAKNILIKVFTENTGKSAECFPNPNLWNQEIKDEIESRVVGKNALKDFKLQILIGLQNMKPIFLRPLIKYLGIIGAMQIVIVMMYDVLRLWFPQLSTIIEHYSLNGNEKLCVLLDNYTAAEKMRQSKIMLNTTEVCVPHISGAETYINSIIIGVVCLLPYFVSGVIVNKVGKKGLLLLSGAICIGALFGIRWASSKTMMVAFFSIDIAVTQTMKSLTQMILIEVFPTTMRSLAMSMIIMMSRLGTLVGNIAFPILLDLGCEIPFYVMIGMMLCLVVLAMFSPKKIEA